MSTNTIECPACHFESAKVSPTKTGGYSVSCSDCGYQGFAKSPKAAAGIKAKLDGSPAATPAASKPGDDLLNI